MMEHAKKSLGLHKDEDWLRQERQRCAKVCMEKRGGEEFNERQRQRALHPAESGWWGGRRNNGSKMSREKRAELARKNLTTDEVQKKAHENRRKTVKRDMRRVELGLEPLTMIRNIGEAMTRKQLLQRYGMVYECRYLKFNGDRNIYYDENTIRSARREKTAEERGITVLPLHMRGKAGITAPHYDGNSKFNNDNL